MKTRKKCKKCRYERCKASGMTQDAILDDIQVLIENKTWGPILPTKRPTNCFVVIIYLCMARTKKLVEIHNVRAPESCSKNKTLQQNYYITIQYQFLTQINKIKSVIFLCTFFVKHKLQSCSLNRTATTAGFFFH